jgi:hypothetical protein
MHHDGHKNSDTYLLRREHAKQLVWLNLQHDARHCGGGGGFSKLG